MKYLDSLTLGEWPFLPTSIRLLERYMSKHAINEFNNFRTTGETYRRQRNRLMALMIIGTLIASVI